MEERRNFIRFQCPTNMLINLLSPADLTVEAFVEDISRGGISLVTNKPLKEKQSVSVGVRIPTRKDAIEAKARVVWCMPLGPDKNKFKSGLTFTELAGQDKENILSYVYEEWRSSFKKAMF